MGWGRKQRAISIHESGIAKHPTTKEILHMRSEYLIFRGALFQE